MGIFTEIYYFGLNVIRDTNVVIIFLSETKKKYLGSGKIGSVEKIYKKLETRRSSVSLKLGTCYISGHWGSWELKMIYVSS